MELIWFLELNSTESLTVSVLPLIKGALNSMDISGWAPVPFLEMLFTLNLYLRGVSMGYAGGWMLTFAGSF
jgi:hypothetical protein